MAIWNVDKTHLLTLIAFLQPHCRSMAELTHWLHIASPAFGKPLTGIRISDGANKLT